MTLKVKICGLRDPDTVRFAGTHGADWIGFVFVEASPRYVTTWAAETLLMQVGKSTPVALLSDADDALIDTVAALGIPILQLHGKETPDRVADIKARTGLEVWKAVGVSSAADLSVAAEYTAADRLLLDAKAPSDAAYAGGHGAAFDWALLKDWDAPKPWMLAGGLDADNVAEAIAATGARAVDVSSGIERMRGLKDRDKIAAFIKAAKNK